MANQVFSAFPEIALTDRMVILLTEKILIPFLNQSAIFVGSVVGFLNVCTYALSPPPCRLDIIFDLEMEQDAAKPLFTDIDVRSARNTRHASRDIRCAACKPLSMDNRAVAVVRFPPVAGVFSRTASDE
ncbi:MAG: hypothetical protein V1766_12115 [Pseudomonadota bacterium]